MKKLFNKIKKFLTKLFKKLSKKQRILIYLVVFLIALLVVGVVFSRYAYYGVRNMYFNSKNFYFNSDKLKDTTAMYQLDNWSGVDSYTIIVNLNSIKNNLVKADSDITYTLSYSCNTSIGPTAISCQASKNGGTILSSNNADSFSVLVTPNINASFEDNDTVNVYIEATSNSPYEKTISGRFILKVGKMGLSYEITDNVGDPFLEMRITNTLDYYSVVTPFSSYSVGDRIDINSYLALSNQEKANCASVTVTLTFNPNIVYLDMTSASYLKRQSQTTTAIGQYQYVNSFSFRMDAISSETIKFYKDDPTINYTYPIINPSSIVGFSFDY